MIKKASIVPVFSTLFICWILAKLTALFKISFIVGSHMAFFSGSSMVIPLTGIFGGMFGSTALFLFNMIFRILIFDALSFKILAYHIPGYFASLYWAFPGFICRIAVPLMCMFLFWAHPVGYQAAPYALYWVIPMFLFFAPKKSIFLHSLGSTFVAHAVGSVIWLYTVEMSSAMWLALIPVVAAERLLYAIGMTGMYHGISWLQTKIFYFWHSKKPTGTTINNLFFDISQ